VLKLEACKRALAAGVEQVRIVGGMSESGLLSATSGEDFGGTRVTFNHPAAVGAQK
jgi:acetylglutamate kinase